MKRALLLLVLAACSSSADAVRIDAVEPAYGPLAGGTRVVVTGDRFVDGIGPTRVMIGGRQAPVANAIDNATLEVVIPPGDKPGDTELVVFNQNGTAVSSSVFHYAATPTIASITPTDVLYNTPSATITVSGSGFLDDGAGDPMVLVGGLPAQGITVTSDSELTFVVGSGRALDRPRIEVVNARGVAAKDRGFRYRPSMRSGLLLFSQSGQQFAVFFDPVDKSTVVIPRAGPSVMMSSIVVDESGEYWGTDRSNNLGRLDLGTQRLEQTIQMGARVPAMARVDGMQYGFDRSSFRFGRFSLDGDFETIGNMVAPCCGSFGVAYDGQTLYFASRNGIAPIDRETGALGTVIPFTGVPGLHVGDMRFFGGKLYAANRDGTIVEIDPVTGVVTTLVSTFRANAMEVFE